MTSVTSRKKDEMCNWISVEERLPEEQDDYLIVLEIGSNQIVEIGYYLKEYGLCVHDVYRYTDYKISYKITHWMPVPEPPKEEGEE